MEDRDDLMRALLDGMPSDDQAQALQAISGSNAQKAGKIQAGNAREVERHQRRSAERRQAQRPSSD